jgi:hypothetical protein
MRELKPLFTTVFVMVFALMGLSAVMSMGKSISKMIQGWMSRLKEGRRPPLRQRFPPQLLRPQLQHLHLNHLSLIRLNGAPWERC